jgi:pimeloyl-ACP methyl ester carboxylesterase
MFENYVFMPPNPPNKLKSDKFFNKKYEMLKLRTKEKDIIPAIYINNNKSDKVILYSHGNAEDLGSISSFLIELSHRLNVSIMGYEYLGYGHSVINNDRLTIQPTCTEYYCYKSIEYALQYLIQKKSYTYENIIVLGQSLGTGPSIEMANRYKLGGIVLISPYKTIIKVIYDYWYLNPLYAFDMFVNEYKITNIDMPVYFIHGRNDEIIHINHTVDLYNLWKDKYPEMGKRCKPLYLKNTGHNDVWEKYEIYDYLSKIVI